jgi:hypothetical protein
MSHDISPAIGITLFNASSLRVCNVAHISFRFYVIPKLSSVR